MKRMRVEHLLLYNTMPQAWHGDMVLSHGSFSRSFSWTGEKWVSLMSFIKLSGSFGPSVDLIVAVSWENGIE